MADTNNGLPEGTDTIIEGGGTGGGGGTTGRSGTTNQGGSPSTTTNSTGGRTSVTAGDQGTDSLITGQTTDSGRSLGSGTGGSGGSDGSSSGEDGSSGNKGGIRGLISNAGTKARDEAANRARGFVGQGLTSGSATLGNVASIIEDTVEQIGERLGPQYGDYARTASQTIQRYASTLENKDPDELVDDVRNVVRKSPSVALAGAAILGFGVARLLRAGISESASGSSGGDAGASTRTSTTSGSSTSAGSTSIGGSSSTGGTTGSTGSTSTVGGTGTSSGSGGGLAGKTQPKA